MSRKNRPKPVDNGDAGVYNTLVRSQDLPTAQRGIAVKRMFAKEIKMTEGPLLGKVLLFVLPLALTNLLQVLYNAADMVVVSLSGEPDAVGAIGTTGAFINLILNLFIGFSVGANVVVARHLGGGNGERASRAVHTSLCMSVLFGIVGGGVGLLITRPVLALMGNTGKLLDLAVQYTCIYFCGVPFLSLANYAISILRAKGDTRTPLYILTLTGLLNVGLNLMFVLGFGMSVDGVAYATAISNAVSAVLLVFCLSRDTGACRFCFRKLRMDRRAFCDILYVGLPAGVQGALFSLSNMLIQSSVLQVNNAICPPDSAYQPVVKGNAASANLENFAYTATNSVHQASVTFTSQNVGAEKYERVPRVMRCCYLVTFLISAVMSGLLLLLREPLLALYGVTGGEAGSLDAIALNTAVTRMLYMLTTYFLLAFMEVGSGVLRGLGKSVTSTVVSLVGSCLLRIVWIFTVFRLHPTLEVIYFSYPLSWGLTAAIHFVCCLVVNRRRLARKRRAAGEKQEDTACVSPSRR